MQNSPYLGQPLRSPAEVMESLQIKHPEMLDQIHALLERAETLAAKISCEHSWDCGPSEEVSKSFEALAESLDSVRSGTLAQADRDLKDWQRARGERGPD